ncbi:ABC transporter ATP-binding protein [Thermus thermophilus]|uniref:ABC transporter ATP-binding protein n=1 Tax=Thermus thermophilus TaxID=274 RepID=A0AAD1KUZ4_THETH|nr:ABC transporter ATP-binding protein [Thermus thermophilus]BCZ86567.1 ABC transporter ATP-binding protein [Thermus thermophilus]
MRALELAGLDAFYGKSHILHGVGLRVEAGELVALLGRNGAGKTTTLKAIMGLLPKRRGRILVFGQETIHAPPHRIALLGVGYVPEGRRIFPYLTVEENLRLVQGKRPGPFSLERVYEIFPRLWERRRHLGRQLSGGEQEMLAIGRALLLNPRLLLLDEPSQGLAPLVVRLVAEVLRGLKKEGVSLLLAEQNAHLALDLADRVYVLDDGRVAYEGEAKALREDPERVRALTGVRRR